MKRIILVRLGGFLLALLLFSACGGGGGGDGGSSTAPTITDFQYGPTGVYVNEGGGTTTLSGSFEFVDPDGDLASMSVLVYDSSDQMIDSIIDPFTDAGGVTSGTIELIGEVDTTVAGVYAIQVFVTDADGQDSNIIEATFRVAEFPWLAEPAMPTPRSWYAAVALDGKVYVLGGEGYDFAGYDFDPLPAVEVYDPQTGFWSEAPGMPTARRGLVAAAVNGRIYASGGDSLEAPGGMTTVEEFDPATGVWAAKTPMPTERWAAAACVAGGKIYVLGGVSGGFELSTVEVYDPALDSWTSLPPMPTPRRGLAAAAVGGKVFALGGYGLPGNLSQVEKYDPATGIWSARSGMPQARTELSASVIENRIFVFGGNNAFDRAMADVSAYDPATDSWTIKTAMPAGVQMAASGVADGKAHVFGSLATWEYTPENDIR